MSTRRPSETAVRRALWLGGLLMVLGGLFGMHGLDSHGVEGVEHASTSGSADHRTMAGATGGTVSATTASISTSHRGMDMDMGTGMCVAILVLGLLALLLAISLRRSQRLMWLVARGTFHMPETQGRDPDPPCLIRLSIQRC